MNWISTIDLVIALVIALTIHEFAHALVANFLGDPTAKNMGRLSLNPLVHLDLLGTFFLLLFHFGWGKPVPVDPRNFKKPITDEVKVALAGPVFNILLALILGISIRIAGNAMSEQLGQLLATMIILNLFLALFNLIPLPPLDGSKILQIFINPKLYFQLTQIGIPILFIVIILGDLAGYSLIAPLIIRPAYYLFSLFTGLGGAPI